jgi:hypothetical protein
MRHESAWERLPDLLRSHEDAQLLKHVASCHACQRQLFLLGRVDRILRAAPLLQRRRVMGWRTAALLTTLAAAATLAFGVFLPRSPAAHAFVLRAADGHTLGRATVVQNGPSRSVVALVARGIGDAPDGQLLLWAHTSDGAGPIRVGRFMVDGRGECRARFTLPTHHWLRFWVTSSSDPTNLVATT